MLRVSTSTIILRHLKMLVNSDGLGKNVSQKKKGNTNKQGWTDRPDLMPEFGSEHKLQPFLSEAEERNDDAGHS
jgi:hypothetical protein